MSPTTKDALGAAAAATAGGLAGTLIVASAVAAVGAWLGRQRDRR